MKTIRCNLKKKQSDFRNFHRIIILENGDTSLKISRNFTCLSKNYTLVYITGICSKHELVSILT